MKDKQGKKKKKKYLNGCIWNPITEYFSCVVYGSISMGQNLTPTSECKESCPKVCSENHWSCNDLCIPLSQPCNGQCMKYITYECNNICIPVNKPCEGVCFYERNINCNGKCLDPENEKELIIKNGCTGERQEIKFKTHKYFKKYFSCSETKSRPLK